MKAAERLLQYAVISSPADENGTTTPSSACQFDMARFLEKELKELGLENVRVTENCFVYATLPATVDMEALPCLGLIAHMDTAPSFNGVGVKPRIHADYDGGEVVLPGSGSVLSPKDFPHLTELKGKTLITGDGTTLLGADDKAGIAEIVTAVEKLIASGAPHGKVALAFTPDEEIGSGVHSFDIPAFGADYAYTVDGGKIGELSFENFNACEAKVEFSGTSVHPGSAKDTMVNACLMAMEFNGMLPALDIPRETDEYRGFFHLEAMEGDVTSAKLVYIVRDHDPVLFAKRQDALRHIADTMNRKWGEGHVTLTIREQYRNMREVMEDHMFIIDNAKAAMKAAGITPFVAPVRGGTDGAQLCYMGLPCPNLCTGGFAFHGPFEHIAAEDMEQCSDMLLHLLAGPRR